MNTKPRSTMPDPELLPHALDMSRPELAPLMRRYSPGCNHAPPSLLRRPTALIVNATDGEAASVRAELEQQGWVVSRCDGPGRAGGCPILRGDPCPLRAAADVALVSVDARHLWTGSGMLPRLRCAVEGGRPWVIALEGSLDSPKVERGKATVGGMRSSKVIAETIHRVAFGDGAL